MIQQTSNKAQVTFDIIREIGQEGDNSQVFLALDKNLNAQIVVKRLNKSEIADPNAFFDEAKIVYLSSHPNVVPIRYACEDDEHIYLALPFYERGSLKSLMAQRFLTAREIVNFSINFLSGLQNIHSKRLIHFDIKPDNILISDSGQAHLSDFGLAKAMDYRQSAEPNKFYGKQIPPEALDSQDGFKLSFDIFQVGMTLYRMCNGDENFYQQLAVFGDKDKFDRQQFKFAVRNGQFPDRRHFLPHVPSKIQTIVRKCLEVDPANRYTSVIQILNQLSTLEGGALDWQYKVTASERTWRTANEDKSISLKVEASGRSIAYKKTSNQEQRIVDGCKSSIDDTQIRDFLKEKSL